MFKVKAIETSYKGYRFRSRLEARWAVFFDALGLPWEYEPEGFELGECGRYLPDFRVHYPGRAEDERHTRWFEVKPLGFSEHDHRHAAFGNLVGGLVLVDGDPDVRFYTEIQGTDDNGEWLEDSTFLIWSGKGRCWFAASESDLYCLKEDERYMQAVRAARGSRYEYGEHGAGRQ